MAAGVAAGAAARPRGSRPVPQHSAVVAAGAAAAGVEAGAAEAGAEAAATGTPWPRLRCVTPRTAVFSCPSHHCGTGFSAGADALVAHELLREAQL